MWRMKIRRLVERLGCHLFSCYVPDAIPECGRCREGIYDAGFVQVGIISWIRIRLSRVRPVCRCANCGSLMLNRGDYCCSDKCSDEWVPF